MSDKSVDENKQDGPETSWKSHLGIEIEPSRKEGETWSQYQIRKTFSVPKQIINNVILKTTEFKTGIERQYARQMENFLRIKNIPLEVDRKLIEFSDECNRKYNYYTSLCRAHSTLIIMGPCVLVAFPTRKLHKYIFRSCVIATFTLTSSIVFISSYKFYRESN
jgi:hypothetical protein